MKKIFLLPLLILGITGCGETPDPGPTPLEKTSTITFLNAEITGDMTGGNHEKFLNWFNSQANILTDFTITGYVQMMKNQSLEPFVTLCIGSASSEGRIDFTFNKKISKITINSQGYYKSYKNYEPPYEIKYSVDEKSEIYLNDDANWIDLTAAPNSLPETKTKSYIFENANKLSFYNKEAKNRAFIHSLTITYIE